MMSSLMTASSAGCEADSGPASAAIDWKKKKTFHNLTAKLQSQPIWKYIFFKKEI